MRTKHEIGKDLMRTEEHMVELKKEVEVYIAAHPEEFGKTQSKMVMEDLEAVISCLHTPMFTMLDMVKA